jgi:hypothetical protein
MDFMDIPLKEIGEDVELSKAQWKQLTTALIDEYEIQKGINIYESEIHHVFVLDRNIGTDNGHGGYFTNYVIINRRGKLSTYTHELGHNLDLHHTFDVYNIPKGSSFNFMDYSSTKNMFFKYQFLKLNKD